MNDELLVKKDRGSDRVCNECRRTFNHWPDACPFDSSDLVPLDPTIKHQAERVSTLLQDRYTLGTLLSYTSRSSVYQAGCGSTGKTFAVKVSRLPDVFDWTMISARISQQESVLHRSICGAISFEPTDPMSLVSVWEYADGPDIKHYFRSKGVPAIPDLLKVIVEVANGLQAAHDCGVIHGDLCPDNIILKNGLPKVCGFSPLRERPHSQNTAMVGTATSYLGYSPTYAAPYQGGPTADVYSLGCILYELLTGSPPFQGESPMHTATMHLGTPIPLISEARPGLKEEKEIDEILHLCMAKKSTDRYKSMTKLSQAIGAILSR